MSTRVLAAGGPAPMAAMAARPWRGLPAAAIAILAALALAAAAPDQGYLLNILMQAATYAIATAGLVVVLGYCGRSPSRKAAFFGIGAYGVALGTADYGMNFSSPWPWARSSAGLFGLILGIASLRLGGHYLAMVTISFQQILTLVLVNWISLTHGPDGVRNIPRPVVFRAEPGQRAGLSGAGAGGAGDRHAGDLAA